LLQCDMWLDKRLRQMSSPHAAIAAKKSVQLTVTVSLKHASVFHARRHSRDFFQ
jgi:hypothetical protein